MANKLLSKFARIPRVIQRIRSSGKATQMYSVQTVSDQQFLTLFNIQEVEKRLSEGDVKSGTRACLAHYADKIKLSWPSVPKIITDLRLNLNSLDKEALVDRAESILQYNLSPDGRSPRIDSQGRIDWCFNPVSTPEWLWRLNRHQWWPLLGLAYQQTGNDHYAKAFVTQMLDWIASNPPPEKKDETSPTWRLMEVGMRLRISWIPCFAMFFEAPVFDNEAKLTMMRSMVDQARFLSLFKTHHNHLLRETNGLAYFSTCFPEFNESGEWQRLALNRFEAELVKQINEDGTHVELSTGYQLLVIDEFTQMFRLLKEYNLSLPNENLSHWIDAMYDMLVYIIKPDFTYPEINDGFLRWGNEQLLPAAKMLGRDDLIYIGTSGEKGNPPHNISASFNNAGLYVMRSQWDRNGRFLLFDAGPYGGWHGHEDKLSVEIFSDGKSFIVDSGSYTYDEKDPFRTYFVGSYGHNTVLVDGHSQVRRWEKSNLKATPTPPQDNTWVTNANYDYAEGSYCEKYGKLEFPKPNNPYTIEDVRHKRRILFVKPHYWLLVDEMHSAQPHHYQILFHAHPEIEVSLKDQSRILMNSGDKQNQLYLLPVCSENYTTSLLKGSREPIQGWYSKGHQKKIPSPVVAFDVQGNGLVRFCTLIFPKSTKDKQPFAIELLDVHDGLGVSCLVATEFGEDYLMFSDNNNLKTFGPYNSHGTLAVIRLDRDGNVYDNYEHEITGQSHTLFELTEEK